MSQKKPLYNLNMVNNIKFNLPLKKKNELTSVPSNTYEKNLVY